MAIASTSVVCAVIVSDGGVLVAQRPKGTRLAGFWEFPGGKVEVGESGEDALIREIHEELACEIVIVEQGPAIEWSYAWGNICLQAFRCKLSARSPEPQALEHSALHWSRLV